MFIPPTIDNRVDLVIYDPATPPQRVRVDGSEQKTMLIEKTKPRCDDDDRETGVVKVAIVIGKDGAVIETDPLAGPGSLISSAVDAVRRWKYKPTLLNGRSVEIETTVEVGFPPKGY
jgi:protein TonB